MVSQKFTFNPAHNVIIHPGGGGSNFTPTCRLLLDCSPVPTKKELEESGQRIKEMVGKIKFPVRFDPLAGSEV